MEESPNGLKPPKPQKRGLTKRPMYILLLAVAVILGFLYYAIEQTDNRTKKQEAEQKTQPDERPLIQGQGPGLSLPSATTPAVVTAGKDGEGSPSEPIVVVQRDDSADKEAETLRKNRQQTYLAALSSPLLAKRSGTSAAGQSPPQAESSASSATATSSVQTSTSGAQPSESYDPAADADKENFFRRADTRNGESGWLSRHTREPGRKYEVKTGTVIPAMMVTGVNSDLPGVMIAQVSQTVYDSATGQHPLLPQGAKLYGVYDARVIYGQRRVLTAWNRVVFPDGSSVTLGAMPGADIAGSAGFEDEVNNHYLRIFGSAMLMSTITAGTSYAVDSTGTFSADSTRMTFQDSMASALAAQMGATSLRLLEKNLNIKPTLEIRPGYTFNVICTKDVAFSKPYAVGTGEERP